MGPVFEAGTENPEGEVIGPDVGFNGHDVWRTVFMDPGCEKGTIADFVTWTSFYFTRGLLTLRAATHGHKV